MNCCDANGNCNQGRDCPVRKKKWEDTKWSDSDEIKVIHDELWWIEAVLFVVVCAGAVLTWRMW